MTVAMTNTPGQAGQTENRIHSERAARGGHASVILVVDDDKRMRESVRDLLGAYGFACIEAGDASEALRQLARQKPDLVLLDIQMPGMSGIDLLGRIKQEFRHLPVIMVSADSTFENATQALRKGAADFLGKPVKAESLLLSVEGVLHKKRLEKAVEQMHLKLGLSEKRHRFIVENSPDIIYMLDEDGNFSFVNERTSSLLGYSPDEMVGRYFADFIHPEDLERVKYAVRERRSEKRASRNVEFRFAR